MSVFSFLSQGGVWPAAGGFFLAGSFCGSLANVLIYRMQREGPLDLMGRSRCPHCRYVIPFYLNVPIFSWFFLRGRCGSCGKGLSFRYPLTELLMACLFAGLFLHIGWKWFLLETLLFAFALVTAGAIDWDSMILPDVFTLSGIALGLLGAAINPERGFLESLFGCLLGGGILWLAGAIYYFLRNREGLGGGDIKLLAWIGSVLSWRDVPFVMLVSCLMGALAGLVLMLRGKKEVFQTAIPFGPCLAAAAMICLFLRGWAEGYLRLFLVF